MLYRLRTHLERLALAADRHLGIQFRRRNGGFLHLESVDCYTLKEAQAIRDKLIKISDDFSFMELMYE